MVKHFADLKLLFSAPLHHGYSAARSPQWLQPSGVITIPLHDIRESLLERQQRFVLELGLDPADFDAVAQVVAETAGDPMHESPVGARGIQQQLPELPVGQFSADGDVVDLARPTTSTIAMPRP